MKVYLDDETIALLKQNKVTEISLDHDLGDDAHGTGYEVRLWLEEAEFTQGVIPPTIYVHSANTSPRHKMMLAVANINKKYQSTIGC